MVGSCFGFVQQLTWLGASVGIPVGTVLGAAAGEVGAALGSCVGSCISDHHKYQERMLR